MPSDVRMERIHLPNAGLVHGTRKRQLEAAASRVNF